MVRIREGSFNKTRLLKAPIETILRDVELDIFTCKIVPPATQISKITLSVLTLYVLADTQNERYKTWYRKVIRSQPQKLRDLGDDENVMAGAAL